MPVFTIGQSRTEPSVLAILVDDTISMRVRDAGTNLPSPSPAWTPSSNSSSRGPGPGQKTSPKPTSSILRFDRQAIPVVALASQKKPDERSQERIPPKKKNKPPTTAPSSPPSKTSNPKARLPRSSPALRSAIEDLQGQRLAGVVILTDGRNTPKEIIPKASPP